MLGQFRFELETRGHVGEGDGSGRKAVVLRIFEEVRNPLLHHGADLFAGFFDLLHFFWGQARRVVGCCNRVTSASYRPNKSWFQSREPGQLVHQRAVRF